MNTVKNLMTNKMWSFINPVAKMIFSTKRASPYTYILISFLATIVREPDNDNWDKLVHIIKYVRGTSNLPLSANGSGILK